MELPSSWHMIWCPPELTLHRRFPSTVAVGAILYVFGGESRSRQENSSGITKRSYNDLLKFDLVNSQWTVLHAGNTPTLSGGAANSPSRVSSCPIQRKGGALTYCPTLNALLLFGGALGGQQCNDLWLFDLNCNSWTSLSEAIILQALQDSADTDLPNTRAVANSSNRNRGALEIAYNQDCPNLYPAPRAYFSTGLYNNLFLVYGGFEMKTESHVLWTFDLLHRNWRMVNLTNDNLRKRFGTVGCVYDDAFFIFGGQMDCKLNSPVLWRLDLKTMTGQNVATTGSSPPPRTYAAATLVGDRWLVHGGSSAEKLFNDLYELNLRTLHWHPSTLLESPLALEGHSITCHKLPWGGCSLLILGGATSPKVDVLAEPLFQATFISPLLNEYIPSNLEDAKIEDFLLRLPPVAMDLIWSAIRTQDSNKHLSLRFAEEKAQMENTLSQLETSLAQKNEQLETAEQRLNVLESQFSELNESVNQTWGRLRGLLAMVGANGGDVVPDSERKAHHSRYLLTFLDRLEAGIIAKLDKRPSTPKARPVSPPQRVERLVGGTADHTQFAPETYGESWREFMPVRGCPVSPRGITPGITRGIAASDDPTTWVLNLSKKHIGSHSINASAACGVGSLRVSKKSRG